MRECFLKNDDLQFDHIISTLSSVADNCLPSILKSLIYWYDSQITNNKQTDLKLQQKLKQQQQIINKM